MTAKPDKKLQILNIADDLLQRRGFNAFSYQDIADEMGMRKASLHYHFPSKGEMGVALAERHANRALQRLQAIDENATTSWQHLDAFLNPFIYYIKSCERMDSSGMLAAEYATLSDTMQDRVTEYFAINHIWLTRVLHQGRAAGEMYFGAEPATKADGIIAMLHGAVLVAITRHNADFIEPLIADIKASLGG